MGSIHLRRKLETTPDSSSIIPRRKTNDQTLVQKNGRRMGMSRLCCRGLRTENVCALCIIGRACYLELPGSCTSLLESQNSVEKYVLHRRCFSTRWVEPEFEVGAILKGTNSTSKLLLRRKAGVEQGLTHLDKGACQYYLLIFLVLMTFSSWTLRTTTTSGR